MPLSIVERDGRIVVTTPYHPSFPIRARSLGGVWDAARRVWVFDAADHDRVRSLCGEIYGKEALECVEAAIASYPMPARHGRNEFAEAAPAYRIITVIAADCASG
jgi:hypothetical protein